MFQSLKLLCFVGNVRHFPPRMEDGVDTGCKWALDNFLLFLPGTSKLKFGLSRAVNPSLLTGARSHLLFSFLVCKNVFPVGGGIATSCSLNSSCGTHCYFIGSFFFLCICIQRLYLHKSTFFKPEIDFHLLPDFWWLTFCKVLCFSDFTHKGNENTVPAFEFKFISVSVLMAISE